MPNYAFLQSKMVMPLSEAKNERYDQLHALWYGVFEGIRGSLEC